MENSAITRIKLSGSERPRLAGSKFIETVDEGEEIGITLVLRFKPDSPPLPNLATLHKTRRFLTPKEDAERYGALQSDIDKVVAFVESHGMTVLDSHAGKRNVCILGTVAQMNTTFGVKLGRYQSPLPGTGDVTRHCGFDGPVYLPHEISETVVAVLGLDDRCLFTSTGRAFRPNHPSEKVATGSAGAATGDPSGPAFPGGPNVGPSSLSVPAIAQHYNFPTPSTAQNQVIGIIAPQAKGPNGNGASYLTSDIRGKYIPSLPGGLILPTLNDIKLTVGQYTYFNNTGLVTNGTISAASLNAGTITAPPYSSILELTQDISTTAAVAQGATINVYFTEFTEQGWDAFLSRVLSPPDGESQPTVLSSSFSWLRESSLGSLSDPSSTVSRLSELYSRLAGQGINAFQSAGDWGADDDSGKANPTFVTGTRNLAYPASDPNVISCGGTILNLASVPPLEWVWSDSFTTSPFGSTNDFGSTGGGASVVFSTPDYQVTAGINQIKDSGGNVISGKRFIPDVAGMVACSGYFVNGLSYGFTGTSCVAPLYAGLAAVLGQAFGIQYGFLNYWLYNLQNTVCNNVTVGNNDSGDTPDSTFFTANPVVPGGWNPCSGWGSIDGTKLLNGMAKEMFTQSLYFVADKSTFGLDEVSHNAVFSNAVFVVLEGFTPNAAGAVLPTPVLPSVNGTGPFLQNSNLVEISVAGPILEIPGQNSVPQRITYPCTFTFLSGINPQSAGGIFPEKGQELDYTVTANFVLPNQSSLPALNNSTNIELVGGQDPFFTNVATNGVYYLSQDLRVFTAVPGSSPIPVGAPSGPRFPATDTSQWNTSAGFQYIQQLLTWLNQNFSNPNGPDPFSPSGIFPDQTNALTGDSSVSPFSFQPQSDGNGVFANYNYAIARVRLNGAPGSTTNGNVRVFFRLFLTQSNDTDYDSVETYPSNFDGEFPRSPLIGENKATIPFFATGNFELNDDYAENTDYNFNGVNSYNITIGSSGSIWQYFGCYLNVYAEGNTISDIQPGLQIPPVPVNALLYGTHHCLVAQIAYDDAPIPTVSGVTTGNCDRLAQRNLCVTSSDNPGPVSTHRIPQTFDIRPSLPFDGSVGTLLDYPDELMIDWGNTPIGSTANIYWPAVNSSDVLAIAKTLYSTHQLSSADANTIQCKVLGGVTYVPIPRGTSTGQRFAGLFYIDLPIGITKGQEFTITVRRLTSRQTSSITVEIVQNPPAGQSNWRYVVGTFEVRIPVTTRGAMLQPEEDTLAIMKWRLQQTAPTNRWYPVLLRYISYIAGRVDGLGGNSGSIMPSPIGAHPPPKPVEYTGKVSGITYDRFGDFESFTVWTEKGQEKTFRSKEKNTEILVRFAWEKRAVISVLAEGVKTLFPIKLTLRRLPNHEEIIC